MCVSSCLRCVAVSLVALAIVCMLSNILLLLPELKFHFLLEGHVTREATWATGLWGSGFLVCVCVCVCVRACVRYAMCVKCHVLCDTCGNEKPCQRSGMSYVMYSCVCLLAAGFCCLVSATGLSQGPLCLYNTTSTPTWGVPHAGYLYNRTLWSGVCLEPREVVQWNVVLFSVMGGASGLQMVFCGANILNSLLGLILGKGLCNNKVCVWSHTVFYGLILSNTVLYGLIRSYTVLCGLIRSDILLYV
uniref:Si:dkey-83h2.3 n=1 Tax=Cyclopterus lumpus TaxID=8103 RepID=A0A8C2X124_CYCLU